jgi:KipI family sensor histidine kinase inhibitor
MASTAGAFPRVLPAGDAAVTVELADTLDLEVCARVRALDRALAERPFAGLVECVPTVRSLLVLFDPARIAAAEVGVHVRERLAAPIAPAPPGSLHEIPVRYGGEAGPDLESVADHLGTTADAVVQQHAGREYTALMLGFTPGFAYLGVLPPALSLPRRATPRTRVPAGSLGLAGPFTGVYPRSSAGGWHLIGRTTVPLFDPYRAAPARFSAGDRVRFVPTDETRAASPGAPSFEGGEPLVEVLEPGTQTTVQDLGRTGYRRYGVARAGAMDPIALGAANHAVGNARSAPGLECTLAGPRLRFLRTTRFAVAGADLGAVLWRSDLGRWVVPHGRSVVARPGNVLAFEGRRSGYRAYVAFAGGLAVPIVMGSCATDVGAAFGGTGGALRAGDLLRGGRAIGSASNASPIPDASDLVRLQVTPGPQEQALDDASMRMILTEEFVVSTEADRAGLRLEGPRLRHRGSAEILSDGMPPGSIQVPPDGAPIVMAAEGPTTGGYVKPLVIVSADLPKLGQLVPGETRVRFWMRD